MGNVKIIVALRAILINKFQFVTTLYANIHGAVAFFTVIMGFFPDIS